ncbi:MAG: VWA domain-containing protein [Promethearchaeota archaeon]
MGNPPTEYTFILIDTSESMLRQEIVHAIEETKKKKRKKSKNKEITYTFFDMAINAGKEIISIKKAISEADQYGIITFNDQEATLVQGLSTDHDAVIEVLNSLAFKNPEDAIRKEKLRGALSLVIQEFAKALKFVGNLMLRVIIITDELTDLDAPTRRLTEIARDIGVYIDILYLSRLHDGEDEDIDAAGYFADPGYDDVEDESEGLTFELSEESLNTDTPDLHSLEEKGLLIPGIEPDHVKPTKPVQLPKKKKKVHYNDIREIAQITDGLFLVGDESYQLIMEHARKLGNIKDLEEGLDVFESAPVRKKKLLSAIAESLVPLSITEIQDEIEGKTDLKCNICFKKESPTGAPFYATGRRCSYCHRTMHLECATKWAAQDQASEEPWIFRCPFCYRLLKVDPSVTKIIDLQTIRRNMAKAQSKKGEKPRETRARRLTPEEIENLIEPCEVCGVILEPDDQVLQCENCKASYHEKCFNTMLEENELHCRRCGYEFISWD